MQRPTTITAGRYKRRSISGSIKASKDNLARTEKKGGGGEYPERREKKAEPREGENNEFYALFTTDMKERQSINVVAITGGMLRRRAIFSCVGRGLAVFPAKDCADIPFPFLKLNTYSNRFISRSTSSLLLSTSF